MPTAPSGLSFAPPPEPPLPPSAPPTSSGFRAPPLNLAPYNHSASSIVGTEPESPVFPTFVRKPVVEPASVDADKITVVESVRPKEDPRDVSGDTMPPDLLDNADPPKWEEDIKSDFDYGKEEEDAGEENLSVSSESIPRPRSAGRKSRPPLPTLSPAIWRIILFQLSFSFIQALACITTIVDMIRRQPPTGFGTQHVAILLAAWGPVIIFGHVPAVRKVFSIWLPWK